MAKRLTKKYKEKIDAEVPTLSNEELLVETLDSYQGDDQDGCFTVFGMYRSGVLERELRRRLYGWLNSSRKTTSVDNSTDKG